MTNLQIDPNFVQDYTEVANLLPAGTARNKQLRIAERLRIMSQTGQEWHAILLDQDRDESNFDSKGLYETIHRLDVEDQKKLQLGIQMMNMFDQFSCGIVIGEYSRAYFENVSLILEPQMTFVISKYDRLLKYCSTEGISTILSPDKTFFEIPTHDCKIFDGNSNPLFADILSDMHYSIIFGSKVVLSAREDLWVIS
jgi:hypothetical protein